MKKENKYLFHETDIYFSTWSSLLRLQFLLLITKIQNYHSLTMGAGIRWLHSLPMGKTAKKMSPGYDSKLHPVVRLQVWGPGECKVTSSFLLFQSSLSTRIVVPVSFLSMVQRYLLKTMNSWSVWHVCEDTFCSIYN